MAVSITHIPSVVKTFYQNKLGTVVFRSAPGIGKTEQVRDAVRKLSVEYGEQFGFIEEHLASRSEVDLRGYLIPENGEAHYTKPDFWNVVERHERGVLFLDELFQCSTEMQKAIAPLLLDGRIGDNVLPEGWIVVGATNGVEHKSGVTPALSHVINRICIMDVNPPQANELAAFYLRAEMPPEVIALTLKSPGTVLEGSQTIQGAAFCTPRALEAAGRVINTFPTGKEALSSSTGLAMIQGFIGAAATVELRAVAELIDVLPSLEDIIASPLTTPIPTAVDQQWLTVSMLGARITREQFPEAFKYISRFPANISFIGIYGCWTRGVSVSNAAVNKWIVDNDSLLRALVS